MYTTRTRADFSHCVGNSAPKTLSHLSSYLDILRGPRETLGYRFILLEYFQRLLAKWLHFLSSSSLRSCALLTRETQPFYLTTWTRSFRPTGQDTAILATSRKVYLEALPVLLSDNEFEIALESRNYQWLRKLGSRGRNELRKLTLLIHPPSFLEYTPRMISLLSQCANLALTIKGKIYGIHALREHQFLKHLHGFGRASVAETAVATSEDCLVGSPHHIGPKQGNGITASLLRQLGSACPPGCRVHVGKATMRPRASVRVECDMSCSFCRRIFLDENS